MKCPKSFSFLPSLRRHFSAALALVLVLMLCGMMQLWSQDFNQSSTPQTQESQTSKDGSNPLLPLLSEQMSGLQSLEEFLQQREQLYQDSLKDNAGLRSLLQQSGETISDLKTGWEEATATARQMGERLKQADMEVAELTAKNLRLEKKIAKQSTVIAVLAGILIVIALVLVFRIIMKVKKIIP